MKKFLIIVSAFVLVVVSVAGLAFLNRQELLRMREGLPQFTSKPGKTDEVMIKMRDGVRLSTVIYHPKAPGPHPAILVRSPYADVAAFLSDSICGRLVRYSYICIFQDTRGQGGSEGEFAPGRNEIEDGSDTLHWIAEQSFHDGNLAMVGPSYLGGVQWAAAAGGLPPEVKTLVPAVYSPNSRDVMYQDGMFRHETFTAWAARMHAGNRTSEEAGRQYQASIRHRPHITADEEIFGARLDWYREMIESTSPSAPYWSDPDNARVMAAPEAMTVPILMVGGYYDVFFGPQFEDWQRLATRSESKFIVGPWTHIGMGGEALDNPNSGGGLFQWKVMLPWLEHHLRGAAQSVEPGLSIYVMRKGEWQESQVWPEDGARSRLFLGGGANAASCTGGSLSDQVETPTAVSYTYDPDQPVPTRGGAGMLAFILPGFDGAPGANQWQDGLCERSDVLSFLGNELAEPVTISGKISVTLRVASSAPDTSFTAKLIEVLPDGRAMNIRDSITTLKYRNGAETERPYVPGEEVDITLDFWPIAWQVQEGSRLRLDISSSDFPKYHAHPNHAEPWAEVGSVQVATQTIIVGEDSYMELPLAVY